MKTIYDELKKDHQKVLSLLDHLISSENAAPETRENFSVRTKPQFSYRFHPKFAARTEYNSGFLRHSTNGKWSKFSDRGTGHKLYTGVVYYPTKSLSLNPSLGWGSENFRLNRTELSLYASYSFL